jgi:hypothetical protein
VGGAVATDIEGVCGGLRMSRNDLMLLIHITLNNIFPSHLSLDEHYAEPCGQRKVCIQ